MLSYQTHFPFMGKNKKKKRVWPFLAASLAGTFLFYCIPLADVVRRSVKNPGGTSVVGLHNYEAVWINESFRLAAANTARFVLTGVPLLLGISLLLAVWLRGKKGMGGTVLRVLFLLPMVLPVSSLAFVWKLFFHTNGIWNHMMADIGGDTVGFFTSDAAFGVLIFTYLWRNLGYAMILWMAAMEGIPKEVYEAAQVDGAGRGRLFLNITLPQLKPAAFTIIILSLLNSFKVFRDAYLISGDYPHASIYLLQHVLNNWFVKMEFGKMTAAAVMVALVISILAGGLHYGLSKQEKQHTKMDGV